MILNQRQVVVHSHERSGTHFLMNTLADNFGYQSNPWLDLSLGENPWSPVLVAKEFERISRMEDPNKLIKSHYEGTFFGKFKEEIFKYFTFLYIYRNSEDCLKSCVKHFNNISWNEGPRVSSVEEMMGVEPSGGCLRYQYKQYPTMCNRQVGHIQSWKNLPKELSENIVYIRFEDLRDKFDETVRKIEEKMDRKLLRHMAKKPDKGRYIQGGAFQEAVV